MATQIPSRETSKYAGQYIGTIGFQRIVEIFTDSFRIALSSKNPETASDRFDLAIETYHQLMSMRPPADVLKSVQNQMETLVEIFPAQVISNEALGLREKARKLKTPMKKLDLFSRAREIIDRGLTEQPSNQVLKKASAELLIEISQSETSST